MKKVVVSMNVTLDGFMSGPNHDLNWHFDNWSTDMGERLGIELNRADTMLLGRITYQAMASYWPMKSMDLLCARDEIALAEMMNSIRKVVYSKTLAKTAWNNSTLISGDIRTAIRQLKKGNGVSNKHIIVYGSSQLVATLIQLNLVDEYQLWIHPVILGKGNHLFSRIQQTTNLRLMGTTTFQSGVVLMNYQLI
jgi:dihydrofolate reductase